MAHEEHFDLGHEKVLMPRLMDRNYTYSITDQGNCVTLHALDNREGYPKCPYIITVVENRAYLGHLNEEDGQFAWILHRMPEEQETRVVDTIIALGFLK